MSIFDLVPLEEPTFEPVSSKPVYGVDYVEERSLLSDILHNAWAGIGEASDIYGRGISSDTLKGFGEYVKSTDLAKPDVSEAFNQEDQYSKVLGGVARSAPINAPMVIGGLGGLALGGGIGATVGAGAAASALARGLYDKSLDDYFQSVPDGTVEDAKDYAFQNTAIEVLTELAATGVDIFTAKLGGQITKAGLKAAISHNVFGSVEDVIGQTAKKVGVGSFLGKVVGASSVGGASEVLAEKLQSDLNTRYGLKTEAPDYFTTFLIGAISEAPFNVGANILETRNRDKIHDNLTKGLTSPELDQRQYTSNQIYETMKKASPEAAQIWKDYSDLNIDKGPLSLSDLVTKDASWKINIKKQEDAGLINQITNEPTKILKEAGIPAGSKDIYGSNPTEPPPLSTLPTENLPTAEERNLLLEKVIESNKVRQEAKFSTEQNPRPDYIQSYSPYAMSKAMGEVNPDSNQVMQPIPVEVPTRLEELQGKKKLTLKEKNELKALKTAVPPTQVPPVVPTQPTVKAEPVATGTAIQQETPASVKNIEQGDLIYSKEDLKGIEVEHTGYNPKTKTVETYKAPAHEVLSNVDEEISLYQDIMRCATGK